MKIVVFIFITALATTFTGWGFETLAQVQNNTDMFKDADGNTYHQLFLDFQATEILEMNYGNDSSDVDGELTPDGYSIVIKNYPGNVSVKMKLTDSNGEEKEVIKSKCFIDPVLLQLL